MGPVGGSRGESTPGCWQQRSGQLCHNCARVPVIVVSVFESMIFEANNTSPTQLTLTIHPFYWDSGCINVGVA